MTMSHVFRGRTLTEAREAAAAALGPDVVLLGRRQVKKKGLVGFFGATEFEVEAGQRIGVPDIDAALAARHGLARYSAQLSEREPAPQLRGRGQEPGLFARGVYEADEDEDDDSMAPRQQTADLARLENEVRAVRAMLHRMTSSPKRLDAQLESLKQAVDRMTPPPKLPERIERLVAASGIDGEPARVLALRLLPFTGDTDGLAEAYRDALADLVRVRPWPLTNERRTLIALVGPPGVGKTTTAARIAAQAIAQHGKTVTFIACDTYRVGAVEQLTKYASLLESPCDVARTQAELSQAIQRAETALVIVDTAGRGPTDSHSVEAGLARAAFAKPSRAGHLERRVLLCVDASLRFADTSAIVERYAACEATEIAVTKLDLTCAPGGLVHATAKSGLPVSLLTHGQRVPDDMAPATAGRILDYLAPRQRNAN